MRSVQPFTHSDEVIAEAAAGRPAILPRTGSTQPAPGRSIAIRSAHGNFSQTPMPLPTARSPMATPTIRATGLLPRSFVPEARHLQRQSRCVRRLVVLASPSRAPANIRSRLWRMPSLSPARLVQKTLYAQVGRSQPGPSRCVARSGTECRHRRTSSGTL